MNAKNRISLIAIVFALISCAGDEASEQTPEVPVLDYIETGDIVINEYCYRANLENEFGDESDWIELHNTTESDIILASGEWTMTDGSDDEYDKFYIPEVTIPGGGYLLIFCDKEDTYDTEIHSNFKIKSKGESIGLYYNGELMDEQAHDSLGVAFECICRENNSENWVYTNESTPGTRNN